MKPQFPVTRRFSLGRVLSFDGSLHHFDRAPRSRRAQPSKSNAQLSVLHFTLLHFNTNQHDLNCRQLERHLWIKNEYVSVWGLLFAFYFDPGIHKWYYWGRGVIRLNCCLLQEGNQFFISLVVELQMLSIFINDGTSGLKLRSKLPVWCEQSGPPANGQNS